MTGESNVLLEKEGHALSDEKGDVKNSDRRPADRRSSSRDSNSESRSTDSGKFDVERLRGDPAVFFRLIDADVGDLSDGEAVNVMYVARQLICRAQALQMRAIERLRELRGGSRAVADEIAPELGISRRAAQNQVALAEALETRLPATLAAMDAGECDTYKASKVFEVVAPLPDSLAREVDARIAPRILGKDPAGIRRMARNATRDVDPAGYAERARERRRNRHVEIVHNDDGMASLIGYLPAEIASASYARICTLARTLRVGAESRTLEQLRADVFADLLLGKGQGQGVRATVYVHVPLDAALGVTDRGCELEGHGPIPAPVAREIMADPESVWRKVITDPGSGAVLDVGRTRYRPPAALAEFVRVRDRECRAPGCHRPARKCDLDHNRAWRKNGDTAKHNLCCLCERHHRLKDEPGWDFRLDPDTGELRITTPTGRTRTTIPEPLVTPRGDSSDRGGAGKKTVDTSQSKTDRVSTVLSAAVGGSASVYTTGASRDGLPVDDVNPDEVLNFEVSEVERQVPPPGPVIPAARTCPRTDDHLAVTL